MNAKICFISEGSYPYIVGGVSSWVHNFIKWFPHLEFKLITINPKQEKKGQYAYQLPPNVTEISEIYFDTPLIERHRFKRRYLINEKEKTLLIHHFSGVPCDWNEIFLLVRRLGKGNVVGFFSSKDFYDIVKEIYCNHYKETPYLDFVWLIRSMYLYQFWILNVVIPQADIYHSVSAGYAGLVGSIASRLTSKSFIMTEHGIYTREREEEIIKSDAIREYARELWIKYFHNMSSAAYKFASAVISLYSKNKDFQENLGCPKEKLMVIPNAIDLDFYKDIEKKVEQQKKSQSEPIIIGGIVRVVPIKDIITMLNGYALAKEKNSRMKLIVLGPTDEDEDYYKYCLEHIRANEIQDVQFTGKVDIKKYLPQIDILLLTSISEAQPLSILEGMTGKIPVIATDVGSCKELLYGTQDNFGEAGIIVPIMADEEIAQAILSLCDDPERRYAMGEAGFKRVSKYFTKKAFLENYQLVYSVFERRQNGRDWLSIKENR